MTSNHAEQARARKMADALACGIDDAFISRLVERFYDTVRQDDMLGPIFAERIGDWPHHLARMKDFWASIMLDPVGSAAIRCASISRSAGLMRRISRAGSRSGTRRLTGSRRTQRSRTGFAKRQRIGESLLTGIKIDRGGLAAISARAAS
jgi:hemoglobin